MADVMTISGAIERARAEGLPVTGYALRKWIKTGALPVRRIGRKALIYWPNLRAFLACVDGGDIPLHTEGSDGYGIVRRLG